MTDETLNGDLGVRVAVATATMPWSPSPSPSVWRKRVHRVGPAESGQVTSVVRYDPDSSFDAHGHPDGEEILVLEGVFTDDRGDWPAGTYLLNPEGYRHAPSSRVGCVLFVKLRQFPGLDRQQVALDTNAMASQAGERAGVEVKPLYSQPGYSDTMALERWRPGLEWGERAHPAGAEFFVVEGGFGDEFGDYEAGTWLRLPGGARHSPRTAAGCTLYVKQGGHRYLLAG
ncbi:MAG TPA: cupin domain-containing protein [Gammaproteobacteria bacterium]|nr:cupin domain-containing protein [Gammaproteobacteria bacterium]